MKKIILSLSLIFAFAAYAIYARNLEVDNPTVTSSGLGDPTPTDTVAATPSPKPTPKPNPVTKPNPLPVVSSGKYKNGTYTGNVADAYYGNVQVSVVISGSKISDVKFLDYPRDRQTSIRISSRAMPLLTSEAIALQDSNVDTVSGASATSAAFRESLSGALAQART